MLLENFKSGCFKQDVDARDRRYRAKAVHWTEINDIDLRPGCSTPRAQGEIGSCTAFAATSMFDFVRRKHSLVTWKPSPLFTYYATRIAVSPVLEDTGAIIKDALKSTVRDGVSMERIWPYITDRYNDRPPEEAWLVAEKHQTLEYLLLNDFDKNEWLNCLNDGYPFIFGLKLYPSFFDPIFTMLGGYMQEPDRENEKVVGAHCMMAVGYVKNYNGKEYLIAQNSWGKDWGDKGYCYIPLSYIMSNDSFDFWTIRLTETTDEYQSDPVEKIEEVKPEPIVEPVVEPSVEPSVIEPVIENIVEPIVKPIDTQVVPAPEKSLVPISLFLVLVFIATMLLLFIIL